MGKQFRDNSRGGFNSRGGPPNRGPYNKGGPGGFNKGGNRGFDQGPPSYVIPYGTFCHKSESNLVVKCTDMARFPKFNRGVYLESKAKIGSVDQIFGPVNNFYFSIKPVEGVDVKSFKEGQVLYMNPEDLLSTDRFTRPQAPRPKGAGGPKKFGGAPGGFNRGPGNFNNRGGPGNFNNRGGPGQRGRPSFNNRGGGRR